MALVDKVFHDDPATAVSNHAFSAALYMWSLGEITRQNVIDAFNLTVTDEIQLDQLAVYYTGLSAADKQEYHSRVEAAGILAEGAYITKAKYQSLLGL